MKTIKSISLILLGVALTHSASAVDWDLQTTANVSLIHTDNIGQSPDALAESDSLLVLAPQFRLSGESARLTMDLGYNPQAIFYDNTDDADQIFHVFDGIMTAELADDRLFVDLVASKFQTIVTPDGAFPIDNIPASNNRADSTVLTVNPYWQQRIGSAQLRIDAAHTRTELDDESLINQVNLQSNTLNTGGFNFSSLQSDRGITWAFDYNYQRLEYDDAIPWEFQRGSGQIGFWVNNDVRLFTTVGRETPFDDFLSGSPDDTFWEVGFQYAPSSRLNLEVAAGDRSFGSTVRASLSYTTARSETTFIYNESPETQGALLAGRRPIFDIDNLNALLDRAGATDRLIRKRGEIRTTIQLNKSTIDWRIFNERRTDRTTAEGVVLPGEELNGAAVRFDWRFGARTSLNVQVDVARTAGGLLDQNLFRTAAGVNYQLSSRVSMSFQLQRVEQDRDFPAEGFDANRATLTFGMRL